MFFIDIKPSDNNKNNSSAKNILQQETTPIVNIKPGLNHIQTTKQATNTRNFPTPTNQI